MSGHTDFGGALNNTQQGENIGNAVREGLTNADEVAVAVADF